jgi:PmbA protein
VNNKRSSEISNEELEGIASSTVSAALDQGADAAEVSILRDTEFSVTVRNGEIENLMESGSRRIGIEIYTGGRKAVVTSTDLSDGSIMRLVREGIELSGIMDIDKYSGLPDRGELGTAGGDLRIYDEKSAAVPAREKIDLALELERAACDMDDRIISDGAACSTVIVTCVLANSLGFCESYDRTSNSISISCAVEDRPEAGENKGKKQSSWWYSTSISFSGLDNPEKVASKAVERTIRKLGAVKPRTCQVPVVFDDVTSRQLLSYLASAASGSSIYRKASFLVDRLGESIGSPMVNVIDDPLMKGRPGSRPFDGEGVRSRRKTVIGGGVLESYLLSSYQARKLSLRTTGNAGGPSNLYMEAGDPSPAEIIASVDNGLYLNSLSGPGANWSTGDFSQGAQGIWIRGGELAEPVSEFTVTGSFERMLSGIMMVGNDLEWRGAVNCPTIRIDSMTVSGS